MIGAADLITGEKLKVLRPVITFLLTLAVCIAVSKLLAKKKRWHDRHRA
jgi:hypothetical protein